MCGRRKLEKEYPEKVDWGDMELDMATGIVNQLPEGIIIQFHNNGEPLLYPQLSEILASAHNQIRTFDTNGKLLVERAKDIIDNMETLTVSVIPNDPEEKEQYEIVREFLAIKGDRKPRMIYRLLGDIVDKERWQQLGLVATRLLHSPRGSFKYSKPPTVPEFGICLDLLTHLVIDRYGDVYPCVRFNPNNYDCLGNVKHTKLIDCWNSDARKHLIQEHVKGHRSCSQLCEKCEFWGIPTGE